MPDKKMLLVLLPVAFLLGCEQHYRYPCQDPDNWGEDFCQKPVCEVNRDCPDYIFKDDRANGAMPKPMPKPIKGDCK